MIQIENGAICKALWVDKREFLEGNKILYPFEIFKVVIKVKRAIA